MSITGIDRVVFGVEDLAACERFYADFGLKLLRKSDVSLDYETINGCEVAIRLASDPSLPPAIEPGPTLRQVIWSAQDENDMARCRTLLTSTPAFAENDNTVFGVDPNGLSIGVRVSRKRDVQISGTPANTWDKAARVDQASPTYDRAEPIEVGHVVFFTSDLAAMTQFYESLGFCMSDRYPGRGHFMRTSARGGHHDVFFLQTPDAKKGLNHVAFTVRDIHEVFGGGMHMSRCGWKTQLGPGKHPISSAIFWYFENPAGALAEYYADEDVLTENWTPRDFQPGPTAFAEWAITGGIDGNTRRQQAAGEAPDGKFITDRR